MRFGRILVLGMFLVSLGTGASASSLLFSDDFDDGNHDGWQVVLGTWAVEGGELSGTSDSFFDDTRIVTGNTSWSDYVLTTDMKALAWDQVAILFRVASIGSGVNEGLYYQVAFEDGLNISLGLIDDTIPGCLGGGSCGAPSGPTSAQYAMNLDEFYEVSIRVLGSDFELSIDGNPVLSNPNLTEISAGQIGFKVIHAGAHAHFDNVSVTQIPEPATALILGFGLLAVGWLRRRGSCVH